jgi:hypothetical protein
MKTTAAAVMTAILGASALRASTDLDVCLDQNGLRDSMNIVIAKGVADKMFAAIDINLSWRPAEFCKTHRGAILITLSRKTAANFKRGALAYARPFEGVHIEVFYDRIELLDYATLPKVLGHVFVHEITHILQAIPWHSENGVMKAHWTDRDYAHMRTVSLQFTREDVELIHFGLAARDRRVSGTLMAAAPPAVNGAQ